MATRAKPFCDHSAEKEPEKVKDLRARLDALAADAVKPKRAPPPPGFKSPEGWGEK